MVAQKLRPAVTRRFFDRLEHVRHVAWVVARSRHEMRAENVGLPFVFAAEAEEGGAEPELAAGRHDLAQPAPDDRAENLSRDRSDFVRRGFGRLRRAVT